MMIAERQRMSLGAQGVTAPTIGTPRSDALATDPYARHPDTYNPAANELPARQAEAPAATQYNPKQPITDEAVRLDLQALLAYAIENAPEYRSEKERLFLATLSLIIERHAWGPRFFNTLSADVAGTPESGDYDTALGLLNDFTVSQRLPYGGDVSVSALVNYTNLIQRASTTTTAEEVQDARINASIDLPLLRGAGQVAREDLIQAERDLVYAARDFERFRREFFVDISNTYFNLLRQQQRINNQELQLAGLERLAEEQRRRNEAGDVPGFEVRDTEAQVLFGKSDLADVVDSYASSLDALKLRIGMPVEQQLVIVPVQIDVPRPALDTAESIRIGQAARLDLQTRGDQVADAIRSVRVAKDRMRGELDLNASANVRTDSGREIGGADFDAGDSDYRVGLSYSPPLDRKIELAQYRSSLIDLERAERDFRVQRDRVALDIRDAIRTIQRSALTLALQEENVELAEKRLTNIAILKRRGTVENRRIIEAEEDRLNARNRRDQALADLQSSVLNYLLQTGQMRVDPQGRWLSPGTLTPSEDVPTPDEPVVPAEDEDDAGAD
ncbi:MAG: TolC family protein [Phycisphaeraceae bacterium]